MDEIFSFARHTTVKTHDLWIFKNALFNWIMEDDRALIGRMRRRFSIVSKRYRWGIPSQLLIVFFFEQLKSQD